jgi:hypothetical protein
VADEPNVDEVAFRATQKLIRLTALRGTPVEGDGCANCYYYLEPGEPMSFCWQEKFQLLVASTWWCQHWEVTPDD